MSYELLDPIIVSWCKKVNVPLIRRHQDSEVRSVDFGTFDGTRFHVWIELPDLGRFFVGVYLLKSVGHATRANVGVT